MLLRLILVRSPCRHVREIAIDDAVSLQPTQSGAPVMAEASTTPSAGPSGSSQRYQQNLQVFSNLAASLEDEAALREKIRDSVRDFDSNVRALSAQWVTHQAAFPLSS